MYEIACALMLSTLTSTATLSAQTLNDSLWVTDGSVNTVVARGNTIYIGGSFSHVGPATGNGVPVNVVTGLPDPGFPRVNGPLNAVVADGAGGWFIGGAFTVVGGVPRRLVAHINPDKSVDPNWNPLISGNNVFVLSLAGATLYIGGDFRSVNGQPRNGVAALVAATGVLKSWNPNTGTFGTIYAVAPLGLRIYLGGSFDSVDTVPRRNLAAVDTSIGRPVSWNPNVNSTVYSILPTASVVYVGGFFGSIGTQQRSYLAAIDATSGIATNWNPGPNSVVKSFALSGSTLYIGGWFTTVGGVPRNRIASVSTVTGVATSWNPNANSDVNALWLTGSTVYAGGFFDSIGTQRRNRLAAIDTATGGLSGWNPGVGGAVQCLSLSGQTIYVGGAISSVGGQQRNLIAAIDATTGRATSWNPDVQGVATGENAQRGGVEQNPFRFPIDQPRGEVPRVKAIALSDSAVFIGGDFLRIGGQSRNNIGAVDIATGQPKSWNPNANGVVDAIALSSSTLYVGGSFTGLGGQARSGLAEVNSSTGAVTNWNPNQNSTSPHGIRAIALSGATVYVGGSFFDIGGTPRNNIGAIDAGTGQVIPSWNPNADGSVGTIVLAESTAYVGGGFRLIGNQTPRTYVAEIHLRTGALSSWSPTPNGQVTSLRAVGQNVYAGGFFDTLGGQRRAGVAAISRSSGAPTTWNPLSTGYVNSITISGTSVYMGGSFNEVLTRVHPNFAAVTDPSLPAPIFSPSSRAITFGPVPLGRTRVDSILVTNTGTGPLDILSAVSDNARFIVTPRSTSINPSNSAKFFVTFAPLGLGTQTARITFTHNAAGARDTVTASGIGAAPGFSAVPTSLSFGTVVLSRSKQDSVAISNPGTSTLTITSATSTNTQFVVSPQSASVPPAASARFSVTFTPGAMGTQTGRIVFLHDAASSPDSIGLAGVGAPAIVLTPGSVSFGIVTFGQSGRDSVTMSNLGQAAVTIASVQIRPPFSISPQSATIPPLSSAKFYVTFVPTVSGGVADTARFLDAAGRSIAGLVVGGTGLPDAYTVDARLVSGSDAGITMVLSNLIGPQVLSARIGFRRAGEQIYDSVGLARIGDTLRGVIPARVVTPRGVEYFLHVDYTLGQFAEFGWRVLQVRIPNLAATLAFQTRKYKMISVPVELSDSLPNSVLADDYGPYDQNKWRLFRWQDGANVEHPSIRSNFTPGSAFWLITASGGGFDVDSAWSVPSLRSYPIQLDTGWNQIANPFAFPVRWDSVVIAGRVSPPHFYNGVEYDPTVRILMPWEGYFVLNSTGVPATLFVPPVETRATLQKNVSFVPLNPEKEYQLQFSAASVDGKLRDSFNYLGLLENALDGEDTFDNQEPPPIGESVQLSIVEGGRKYFSNYKPVSPGGQDWRLELRCTVPDQQIQVSLSPTGHMPTGFSTYVLDETSYNIVPVSGGMFAIHLRDKNAVHIYRIILGTPAYAAAHSGGIPLVPLEYSLSQNYPNPFNPTTTIRYQVSQRSKVRLEIFNVLGQRVRTLIDAEQVTGTYGVEWDGNGDGGRAVASGFYFYRLSASQSAQRGERDLSPTDSRDGQAADFVATRKMLLLR